MVRTISPDSIIVATRDQVSCDLDGEAAILNLKDSAYYGLESVGATVWNLVQQPRSFGEIRAAILDEYEVSAEDCERDLVGLVNELAACGLIEVSDAPRP